MIGAWDLFDDRTGQVWESLCGHWYVVVRAPKWIAAAPNQAVHEALCLENGTVASLLETVDDPWENARGAKRIA